MRFKVQIGEVIVGETNLEGGDAPMRAAFGALIPNNDFNRFLIDSDKDGFIRADEPIRVLAQTGEILEPAQAVAIQVAEDEIDVSILGLDGALYERWFRAHIEAYEQHLSSLQERYE
jgi:hypothetical protein